MERFTKNSFSARQNAENEQQKNTQENKKHTMLEKIITICEQKWRVGSTNGVGLPTGNVARCLIEPNEGQ